MALAHQFEYLKPESLPEAVGILSKDGQRAQILAGGTDLIPWIEDELVVPEILVDIKGIAELEGITVGEHEVRVGALVTFSELINSDVIRQKLPLVFEMAKTVASPGIRNRATLLGNICSAVPSCDSGPVLLVSQARIRTMSSGEEREISAADWFRGPRKCALEAGEMATELFLPLPGRGCGGSYLKLGRYRGEDLAQASVAVLAMPDDRYRVAFGAVAPTPVRASRIEALIDGKELTAETLTQAQHLVPGEIAPITDLRATEQYRRHMIGVMLERSLKVARARCSGEGPPYGSFIL